MSTEILERVVLTARRWRACRERLRRVKDSKSASDADVQRASRALLQASQMHEKAIIQLERQGSMPTRSKGIDWAQVLGVVATVANGVEQAVKPVPEIIDVEVIDTEGTSV